MMKHCEYNWCLLTSEGVVLFKVVKVLASKYRQIVSAGDVRRSSSRLARERMN